MQIISVINQKGGVGKTTTVINLAAGLTHLNKKILVIDLDPQGNATTGLGLSNVDNSSDTIYGVLNGTREINEIIKKTQFENLDIITSNVDFFASSNRPTRRRSVPKSNCASPSVGERVRIVCNFVSALSQSPAR